MAQKEIVYKDNIFKISYEILNPDLKNTAVILHGWGANKEIMKAYFNKLEFKQIYIDLPGFGKSESEITLDSFDYAKILEIFLSNFSFDTIIGHSFGGKIATLLKPKNLILLSSAGILEPKPLSVKFKIRLAKFVKKIGLNLNFLVSKDGACLNDLMYETFKNVVKEDFSEIFKNTTSNTLIFWGKDDKAVSLRAGKKINSLIKNSKFYPLEGDHFFFIKQNKFIIKTIQEQIK